MYLKLNFDKKLYYSDELNNSVNNFFNTDKFFPRKARETIGEAKSTSIINGIETILSLPGFDKLFEMVSISLLNVKNIFSEKKCEKIFFTRIWMNEMFKNSSSLIHIHHGDVDGIAVFYYKVPKNSSQFVMVNEKVFSEDKLKLEDYSKEDLTFIEVNEGDLIIHDASLPHGVSKHLSDDSRICFVFNFKFLFD